MIKRNIEEQQVSTFDNHQNPLIKGCVSLLYAEEVEQVDFRARNIRAT